MTRTINLEIEDTVLEEAMRLAKTSEPTHAVLEALAEFTRPRSQKDLIKYLGTFDGFYTAEELEELRAMD